jgi:predicted nucleic acid-binding protein
LRLALDTNILVYAEGVNGPLLKKMAVEILRKVPPEETFVPVQVLGELFYVLIRKARATRENARAAILAWRDDFSLIETSEAVLLDATNLSVDHGFRIWDAIILAAAATVGCRLLLSEDLQEGFTWSGVTVVNPFSPAKHELLRALLSG